MHREDPPRNRPCHFPLRAKSVGRQTVYFYLKSPPKDVRSQIFSFFNIYIDHSPVLAWRRTAIRMRCVPVHPWKVPSRSTASRKYMGFPVQTNSPFLPGWIARILTDASSASTVRPLPLPRSCGLVRTDSAYQPPQRVPLLTRLPVSRELGRARIHLPTFTLVPLLTSNTTQHDTATLENKKKGAPGKLGSRGPVLADRFSVLIPFLTPNVERQPAPPLVNKQCTRLVGCQRCSWIIAIPTKS